jgi:hypothetical protein
MFALPPKADIGWIGAMLTLRGRGHFTDTDVMEVAMLTLTGLAQQSVASERSFRQMYRAT